MLDEMRFAARTPPPGFPTASLLELARSISGPRVGRDREVGSSNRARTRTWRGAPWTTGRRPDPHELLFDISEARDATWDSPVPGQRLERCDRRHLAIRLLRQPGTSRIGVRVPASTSASDVAGGQNHRSVIEEIGRLVDDELRRRCPSSLAASINSAASSRIFALIRCLPLPAASAVYESAGPPPNSSPPRPRPSADGESSVAGSWRESFFPWARIGPSPPRAYPAGRDQGARW